MHRHTGAFCLDSLSDEAICDLMTYTTCSQRRMQPGEHERNHRVDCMARCKRSMVIRCRLVHDASNVCRAKRSSSMLAYLLVVTMGNLSDHADHHVYAGENWRNVGLLSAAINRMRERAEHLRLVNGLFGPAAFHRAYPHSCGGERSERVLHIVRVSAFGLRKP